jgi:hypothetical protein
MTPFRFSGHNVLLSCALACSLAVGCSSDKSSKNSAGDDFPAAPSITNSVGAAQLATKADEQMAFAFELVNGMGTVVEQSSSGSLHLDDSAASEELPAPHEVLASMSVGDSSGAASLGELKGALSDQVDENCDTSLDIIRGTLNLRKVLVGRRGLSKFEAVRRSANYTLVTENSKSAAESINYTVSLKPEVAEKTGTAFTADVAAGSDGDTYFSRVDSEFSINLSLYMKNIVKTVVDALVKGIKTTVQTMSGSQATTEEQSGSLALDGDSAQIIIDGSLKSLLNLSSSAKTLSYDFDQQGTWSRKDASSGTQTVWASVANKGQFSVNGTDKSVTSEQTMTITKPGQSESFQLQETGRVTKVGDKELEFELTWTVPSVEPIQVTGRIVRNEGSCRLTVTTEADLAQAKQAAQEAMANVLGIQGEKDADE